MKKVLIITYYWPPAGGPGVQRILNFVKYLPENGWQPVVLTVKSGEYPEIDTTLLNEVPTEIPIFRTSTAEPYTFYRWLVHGEKAEKIPTFVLTESEDENLLRKMSAIIRGNIFIPDAKIGWRPFAVKKAKEIFVSHDISLVFSTSPPQTVNLIAKKISGQKKIPWIADLRDPWTDIFYYHRLKRYEWAKKLDRYLERTSLEKADSIITVSPFISRMLQKKIVNRYHVIPNGFDHKAFIGKSPVENKSVFRIVHTGHLAGNQNPEILWDVLRSMILENTEFRENLKIEFYGRIHSDIKMMLETGKLKDHVHFHPYIPHNQVVEVMMGASILFFAIPVSSYSEGILTSKLFDYIGARRPILGIGPPRGDAAQILNELNFGKIFDYRDHEGVRRWIASHFKTWKSRGITEVPSSEKYLNYSRQHQTGILAQIFNTVLEDYGKQDS